MTERDQPSEEEKAAYEARLRKRLLLLKKKIEEGKITIAPGLRVIDSLKAVRYGRDGQIDLNTVDGLVRSMALAVEGLEQREQVKKSISLAEIQREYFGFIERNFGHFYKIMLEKDMTPGETGYALSRSDKAIAELTARLQDFLEAIEVFWQSVGEAARVHLEDMTTALKGVFGGDLFPAHTENIASKCGLYTDTIILPCPFMRSRDLFKRWKPRDQAFYLIKHAMSLLQYKDLACAEVTPPIIAVMASPAMIDEDERGSSLRGVRLTHSFMLARSSEESSSLSTN